MNNANAQGSSMGLRSTMRRVWAAVSVGVLAVVMFGAQGCAGSGGYGGGYSGGGGFDAEADRKYRNDKMIEDKNWDRYQQQLHPNSDCR